MSWIKAEVAAHIRKVAPTDGDLELIERSLLPGETFNPDDFFVGRMSLANTLYDRSGERFPEAYLQRFAATIAGKGVMVGHDYTREPAGHFYTAKVEGGADWHELVPSYYLLNADPLTAKVKAGIARHVSLGFNPDLRICDLCEKDYDGWHKGDEDPCPHIALREYDGQIARVTYGGDAMKAEALEGSFVWLGCQYGAETMGANQALSPRAKTAFFEDRSRPQGWPGVTLQKERAMPHEVEKGAGPGGPPAEAKLTADQERLIALGKAYELYAAGQIKSRYGACRMERTGERLAAQVARMTAEEIDEELKAADATFNEHFPGTGKGVPMSESGADDQALVRRKFNPLARNGRF